MIEYDKFGQPHCSADHLFEILYENPKIDLTGFQVSDPDQFNKSVERTHTQQTIPRLKKYTPRDMIDNLSVEKFDEMLQSQWQMPNDYKNLDIVQWLIDKCDNEDKLQRVAQELLLFQDRNLMDLLRYMKFMVDMFRKNKIVWGVGRGSSVASYCLYLIGVHKIDSLYYGLEIEEFLKGE